jgi:hypothetical protein
MSDNMELTETSVGDLAKPSQQSSQNDTVKTSPVDANSIAEALLSNKNFLNAVVNQTRSIHDKRTVDHEKRLSDAESILARFKELKNEGLSDGMALRFMAMEDQIKPAPSVDEKRVLPESVEGTAPKVAVEISDTLIEDYAIAKGIDPKSAEYLELARTSAGKKELMLQGLYDLSERRKKGMNASPADILQSTPGSNVSQGESIEEMTARINSLFDKHDAASVKERRELTKKLEIKLKEK